MRFIPDYKLNILRDNEFAEQIENITELLKDYRNSGFFKSFDGERIFYEYFLAENSKASIVVVHGLSEFTKKFYEVTAYFLNQGYNVFLYDQRCHGFSSRLTDRIDLIHVDSFQDYVEDLSLFIEKIVLPADEKPLFIYSHSMGGAVTAMYLAEHGEKIKKAILSAPLFEPQIGNVSLNIARAGIKMNVLLAGKKTKYRFSKEFNPDFKFEDANDLSYHRFLHNMDMRRNEKHYQTTPMTLGWIYNSLKLRSCILKKRIAGSIKTPILLLSAENDTVVKNEAQHIFAKKCASCELVTVKGAKHSMLTGSHDIITEHLTRVMDFFSAYSYASKNDQAGGMVL